jgi:hypothetical protein
MTPPETIRIAMWSGPRNISTAMMRSFGARADCAVSDEPFYGFYLDSTGIDHPMRADIIAAMDCAYDGVAARITGPAPNGAGLWYQKHMTHHMIDGVDLGWTRACRNAFLIRDPRRVVASYAAKRRNPTDDDIGIKRQRAIFETITTLTGARPPVIDAADVLAAPDRALRALCRALDIAFDPAMLSWEAGRRASDGVWAAHWYASVEASTGFQPPSPDPAPMDPALERLADDNRAAYETMAAHTLEI